MWWWILGASSLIDALQPPSTATTKYEPLRSVVKVFCTITEPDHLQPWSWFGEESAVGSGFLVEDLEKNLRILTNAHVVNHASEIRVRRHGETRMYKARAIGVGHDCDLALLAVDDGDFWSDVLRPLDWAPALPKLFDDVACVGYPLGGESICVTRGVVSRVDAMPYAHGAPPALVVQIDAAINSGNSGGPAVDENGHVAGVAFSGYAGSADNIGYLIPASVAQNFLYECRAQRAVKKKDEDFVADVKLCALGVTSQRLENQALQRLCCGSDDASDPNCAGVLITRVAQGSSCAGLVHPGDVLIAVDGKSIANDGTVALRDNQRVYFSHAATARRHGDHVNVTVLRRNEKKIEKATFEVKLKPLEHLVPYSEPGRYPSYVVFGGLVLMPLSVPLMAKIDSRGHTLDDDDQSVRLAALHAGLIGLEKDADPYRRQIVVWSQTLATDANFGYSHLCRDLPILDTINGHPVRDLEHAAVLLFDAVHSGDNFVILHLIPPNPRPGDQLTVVLDVDDVLDANEDLIRRKTLPYVASEDIWDALIDHQATKEGDDVPAAAAERPLPVDQIFRRRRRKGKRRRKLRRHSPSDPPS